MKAYGKKRRQSAGRTISGTSRPCPCCEASDGRKGPSEPKTRKRRARDEGKDLIKEELADPE